jgi:hypothetical protein
VKDTIFYVGGGKGGVGKSMISFALVQFLIDRFGDEKTVHIIETDESNPDVGRVYKSVIPMTAAALDDQEAGWIRMANAVERERDALFVINSAARSSSGIRKHGGDFAAVLASGRIPYELVTFWLINRQKDSVTLLEEFIRHVPFGAVYVVRNTYFGDPEAFTLYARRLSESEEFRGRVAATLDFPALADIIADDFYTGGMTIPDTMDCLGAFAAQSFMSWRNRAYAMFESTGLFDDAASASRPDGATEPGEGNENGGD